MHENCSNILGLAREQIYHLTRNVNLKGISKAMSELSLIVFILLWLRQSLTERFLAFLCYISNGHCNIIKWKILDVLYAHANCHLSNRWGTSESRLRGAANFYGRKIVMILDGTEQQIVMSTTKSIAKQTRSGKKTYHTLSKLVGVTPNMKLMLYSNTYTS